METTESDVGYPEEQPPEVDDTPAEGTPQREGGEADKKSDNDDGKATGQPEVGRVADRPSGQLEREHGEIVARRRAAAERARHEALHQSRRPVHRRGPHRGQQLRVAPHPGRRARLGQPVGVEHQRVAGMQVGRCAPATPDRARARAASPARRAARPHPDARRSTGSGCPPHDTVTRAGDAGQIHVRAGDRAEPPAGRVLVEHRLADPAQDRRPASAAARPPCAACSAPARSPPRPPRPCRRRRRSRDTTGPRRSRTRRRSRRRPRAPARAG